MVRNVLGWYRSFVTANILGISVVFLGRTKSEWDLLQNEIFRKPCYTPVLVRMVVHPLIDLEQLAVVLLVCTRMREKKIPALSVCLLWQPRLNRGKHLQRRNVKYIHTG